MRRRLEHQLRAKRWSGSLSLKLDAPAPTSAAALGGLNSSWAPRPVWASRAMAAHALRPLGAVPTHAVRPLGAHGPCWHMPLMATAPEVQMQRPATHLTGPRVRLQPRILQLPPVSLTG